MAGHHFEELYKAGLSFATQNMESEDGFVPFAITIDDAGEKRLCVPGPDPSIADTAGQVDLLERLVKQRVGEGTVVACVLVTDALFRNPETGDAIDILAMDLDDVVGGPGRLVFPYRIEDGKWEWGSRVWRRCGCDSLGRWKLHRSRGMLDLSIGGRRPDRVRCLDAFLGAGSRWTTENQ